MAFKWREGLAVGNAVIDEQHQELFARVNALLEAMMSGRGDEEVCRTISFLERYTVEHFAAEEQLMREAGYPDCGAHAAEHAAFAANFEVLAERLRTNSGLALPILQVQREVCDWLMHHLGKSDRALGEFLRSQSRDDAAGPRSGGGWSPT